MLTKSLYIKQYKCPHATNSTLYVLNDIFFAGYCLAIIPVRSGLNWLNFCSTFYFISVNKANAGEVKNCCIDQDVNLLLIIWSMGFCITWGKFVIMDVHKFELLGGQIPKGKFIYTLILICDFSEISLILYVISFTILATILPKTHSLLSIKQISSLEILL
jgi:hypothetical protein